MSPSTSSPPDTRTWLIVGASRGIGFEFVRQLRALNHRVVATVRTPEARRNLFDQFREEPKEEGLTVIDCDVTCEKSIHKFAGEVAKIPWLKEIDVVVVNAGVLNYPSRATEASFSDFQYHFNTNAIGPLTTAQHLLKLSPSIPISTLVFISSDSGSTTNFLVHEDGFAAYSASKAALNQGLRHLAAELHRKKAETVVLALHPGEVSTDMANIDIDWTVEGVITPHESVKGMLKVIEEKGKSSISESHTTRLGKATFWTWNNTEYAW